MTKLKKYQVEEDNNSSLSIVELIDNNHEDNKDDARRDTNNANEKTYKTEITQSEQLASTNEQQIPRWQRNLQTFYNPSRREDEEKDDMEYGEMAYLSMLEESIDEPNFFNQA
jgi:hypothetical protein